MGPGQIGASEEGMIHLGPPQIALREVYPGQIGRSEIRAAALTALRFNVQLMRREDLSDLIRRQLAMRCPCRKVDKSGKGRSRPLGFCHAATLLLSAEDGTGPVAGCPVA